jgi:hypothetical protein
MRAPVRAAKGTPPTLALQSLSDRHASEESNGKRKPWQLLRQIVRQIHRQDRMCGKSVEAGDGFAVGGENEDGCKAAPQILGRLALKIGIQFGNSAAKRRFVMSGGERLYPKFGWPDLWSHYEPARFR